MDKGKNIRVLLVDDCPVSTEAISMMLELEEQDICFKSCSNPEKAIELALGFSPTVMLLDLIMPEMGGLELVSLIRAHPELQPIPIIVLSAEESPEEKANAFEGGANDYLVKTPHRVELMARIRYHSEAYGHRAERDQALSVASSRSLFNLRSSSRAWSLSALCP